MRSFAPALTMNTGWPAPGGQGGVAGGIAAVLAAAAQSYQEAIEAIQQSQGSLLLDEQAIRESLRASAWSCCSRTGPWRPCRLSRSPKLVPADQVDMLAGLVDLEVLPVRRAGDLYLQQGRDSQDEERGRGVLPVTGQVDMQDAHATFGAPARKSTPANSAGVAPGVGMAPGTQTAVATAPATDDLLTKVRDSYAQAGDVYARLAKLRICMPRWRKTPSGSRPSTLTGPAGSPVYRVLPGVHPSLSQQHTDAGGDAPAGPSISGLRSDRSGRRCI